METIENTFGTKPFRTDQAQDLGLTRFHLNRLLDKQLLRTPLQGVYQVTGAPLGLAARAQAVALVLPAGGAIARGTVAWLLGVDPRAPSERNHPLPVECIVPVGPSYVRRPGLRCSMADLDESEMTWIGEVPCTSPARTAADLLRWSPPHMGLAVVDALVAAELVTGEEIDAALERVPGRRFVRQARRLADWIEPLTESYGESWLRLRLLEAGFPRPQAQIPIGADQGRAEYRLDLGWPERRIGIEYDGREFHSTPEAIRADERRRSRLASRYGWHVIGVGLGEVLGRSVRLENGVGELLGLEPRTRRRTW